MPKKICFAVNAEPSLQQWRNSSKHAMGVLDELSGQIRKCFCLEFVL